mgnify:CR=1 FL=1
MHDIHSDKILILDFGSQYTQLIARRVREVGVYCEIWPWDNCEDAIREQKPAGIILSGGPETVTGDEAPSAPDMVFELGVPVLGICYGMQTMAAQLGGEVVNSDKHEYGYARVRARGHSTLLREIEDHVSEEGYGLLDVWMSHGDRVEQLPDGFMVICTTDDAPIAGMADEKRRFYGLQFHPEVTHTTQGGRILERFLFEICACEALWNPNSIIDDGIRIMQEQIGDGRVVLGLSGGIDSALTLAVAEALGVKPERVFINPTDTGTCPWDVGTHASRGAFMAGNAALQAADRVREVLPRMIAAEQRYEFLLGMEVDMLDDRAVVRSVAAGDPAAENQDVSGTGMQKQRQIRLALVRKNRGRPPHLKMVVDF